MKQIGNHIYVEGNLRACNIGIIDTRQGTVMIDTPMVPGEAKQFKKQIADYGDIRYIINSEPHPDHVAGNCWFGGTIIAHEGTRQSIDNVDPEELISLLRDVAPDALPLDSEFKYRLPEITFSQRLSLSLGEYTFRLINLPGHTPYQLAVYIPEERVLFTSDNVVREIPIFNRLSNPDDWLESLRILQQMDVDKVVPGHGEVCEKKYLEEMYRVILYWTESARSAVLNGWNLEQAIEKITLDYSRQTSLIDERMKAAIRRSLASLYGILKEPS